MGRGDASGHTHVHIHAKNIQFKSRNLLLLTKIRETRFGSWITPFFATGVLSITPLFAANEGREPPFSPKKHHFSSFASRKLGEKFLSSNLPPHLISLSFTSSLQCIALPEVDTAALILASSQIAVRKVRKNLSPSSCFNLNFPREEEEGRQKNFRRKKEKMC